MQCHAKALGVLCTYNLPKSCASESAVGVILECISAWKDYCLQNEVCKQLGVICIVKVYSV